MHFHFFKSTYSKDTINGISIFTNSAKKAYALAYNYFVKNNLKGEPLRLTI